MSDTPVETHVVVDEGDGTGPRAIHFQEWWVRMRAAVPAQRFVAVGMDRAAPGPGVLDAIREADVILLPPSNPVVSIGIILGVPGVRDALRGTRAPVVGVSPLIGGAPVRGHADACLSAIGVDLDRRGGGRALRRLPGRLAGRRRRQGAGRRAGGGSGSWPGRCWMHDVPSAADIAGAALDLAASLRDDAV